MEKLARRSYGLKQNKWNLYLVQFGNLTFEQFVSITISPVQIGVQISESCASLMFHKFPFPGTRNILVLMAFCIVIHSGLAAIFNTS